MEILWKVGSISPRGVVAAKAKSSSRLSTNLKVGFCLHLFTAQHGGASHSFSYFYSANLENTYNVEPCYFQMHQNCRVTLYQDACVPKNLPQFANLPVYPASCWHDLYDTIMAAKEVICITGWSVWDKLQLFRGEDQAIDKRTLGEILKDKAKEGVKVWIMLWSLISNQVNLQGVMTTHHMDTYNYFQDSGVYCCLAPR